MRTYGHTSTCRCFYIGLLIVLLFFAALLAPASVSAANEEDRSAYEAITGQNIQGNEPEEDAEQTIVDNDRSAAPGTQRNIFMLLLQVVFALLLVIGLIYGLVRFLGNRQKKIGHHRLFQHLGGMSLGANKSLQLIKLGGKIYFIGVADQIQLIKEMTDPEEIRQIEAHLEEPDSLVTNHLFSWIQSTWNRRKEPVQQEDRFQALLEKSLVQHRKKREQAESRLTSSGEFRTEGEQEEEGRYQ